ncbi:hypothetical protein FGO68_gene8333 [Halteria grandinella]|uniref:Uncharacterized protein n=1 Tax=Halteria grandinella TaxID=5974 RepID=A0A8J8SVP7_HALGN|nr:hypothetical protein FGO68_gene8333 [Halteria grandinella]
MVQVPSTDCIRRDWGQHILSSSLPLYHSCRIFHFVICHNWCFGDLVLQALGLAWSAKDSVCYIHRHNADLLFHQWLSNGQQWRRQLGPFRWLAIWTLHLSHPLPNHEQPRITSLALTKCAESHQVQEKENHNWLCWCACDNDCCAYGCVICQAPTPVRQV